MSGHILTYDELYARLGEHELFRDGSWAPENLRGAAYDLRIAKDFMIIPSSNSPSDLQRYPRGHLRNDPVILQPGDVGFFSTQERLCIPWDVCANIGIKFSYPRRGILVLTGLLVDPGFGLTRVEEEWVPRKDERLHFLLVNAGHESISLVPGSEKIASIQFFSVAPPSVMHEVPSSTDMEAEFFSETMSRRPGFAFFPEMARVRDLTTLFDQRIDVVEKGTNQVVMFGVYLLCTSILAASFAAFLALVSSDVLVSRLRDFEQINRLNWPGTIAVVFLALSGAWIVHSLVGALATLIRRRP